VRVTVANLIDDPSGPFADVHPDARAMLKQFAHHRNAKTAEITPSVPFLAHALPYKDRRCRYVFGMLDEGPSVQRDGAVIEGLGLVQREKRWRPGGGQTSNLYVFTYAFWLRAKLVEPHTPEECACCRAEQARTTRRGRPSQPRPVIQPRMQPQPRRPAEEHQAARAAVSSPETPAPVQHQAEADDPSYLAFAAAFAEERAARYDDGDAGTLRAENRAKVASYVLDLTAEANAWAKGRGLALEWSAIREDLCRRMVRAWLALPGSNGFLDERRHPIGLMVDDLARVGPEALGAWKRAQPKPKIIASEPPQVPPPPVLEVELPATSAEPAEDPAEVRALCAELLGRLSSSLDPAAQHDATWSAPAVPVVDELAEVRAKAAAIEARGGGEAAPPRAMSVLLAEQAEPSDDPATVVATTTVERGRRTRSSVALFLPGVVPPAEPAKAEAEEEPEEPAQIGEERQAGDEGRSRRAPPYTPRSRRGRGS
jgi:hypothetical protein